jgi:hypothetical protein
VDTWDNATMPDGIKDTYNDFLENTKDFRHAIKPVRKQSSDLVYSDIDGLLDFAFIDGDHSENAVRSDFLLIKEWVKPGGYLLMHDVTYFPGVNIVLGEALASRSWHLIRLETSLAVLKKNEIDITSQ